MSIELDCEEVDKIKAFLNELKMFSIGVSWGGHEDIDDLIQDLDNVLKKS